MKFILVPAAKSSGDWIAAVEHHHQRQRLTLMVAAGDEELVAPASGLIAVGAFDELRTGAMSVIEAGARLTPRRPSQVPSFARSNNGRCRRAVAAGVSTGAARSGLPKPLALRSIVGGVRSGRRMRPQAVNRRSNLALTQFW
jgi:hypothetical protein